MKHNNIARRDFIGVSFVGLAAAQAGRLDLDHGQQLFNGIRSPTLLPESEQAAEKNNRQNDAHVYGVFEEHGQPRPRN